MIGNNSCGTHSVMGGKTVDNVIELDVVTYDGTRMTVGPTSEESYLRIVRGGTPWAPRPLTPAGRWSRSPATDR